MNTDFLIDIYLDPSIGLKSVNKMYIYLKTKHPNKNITKKELNDFLSKRKENQLFKQVKTDNLFNKTIAENVGYTLQIDTMDFNSYKSQNKGYRYILVCIDVYSRKVFLRALLDKVQTK